MSDFLQPSDLPAGTGDSIGLTKEQMIDDAESLAYLSAPCLVDLAAVPVDERTPEQVRQVKATQAILRGAIMRWSDAGSGGATTVSAGTLSETVDQNARKGMFWPSEITSLQKVCSPTTGGGAFSVDTVGSGSIHADVCNLNFGAQWCSCGADLAGFPLYEVDSYQ